MNTICIGHHCGELFFGEKEVNFGCFYFSTYKDITKVVRAVIDMKRWIFKGVFAIDQRR